MKPDTKILLRGSHAFAAYLVGAAAIGAYLFTTSLHQDASAVREALFIGALGGIAPCALYCFTAHVLAHYILHRNAGASYLSATWNLAKDFVKATWLAWVLSVAVLAAKHGTGGTWSTVLLAAQIATGALFWFGAVFAVYEGVRTRKLREIKGTGLPQVRR